MYESYYDKLQPYFGLEIIQIHYMDTDSFAVSVKTKLLGKTYKILKTYLILVIWMKIIIFLLIKKVISKFKIETPTYFCADELICLRSKMYAIICGKDGKNWVKGISKAQLEIFEFEDFQNCLFGGEYQKECHNYLLRSNDHEM